MMLRARARVQHQKRSLSTSRDPSTPKRQKRSDCQTTPASSAVAGGSAASARQTARRDDRAEDGRREARALAPRDITGEFAAGEFLIPGTASDEAAGEIETQQSSPTSTAPEARPVRDRESNHPASLVISQSPPRTGPPRGRSTTLPNVRRRHRSKSAPPFRSPSPSTTGAAIERSIDELSAQSCSNERPNPSNFWAIVSTPYKNHPLLSLGFVCVACVALLILDRNWFIKQFLHIILSILFASVSRFSFLDRFLDQIAKMVGGDAGYAENLRNWAQPRLAQGLLSLVVALVLNWVDLISTINAFFLKCVLSVCVFWLLVLFADQLYHHGLPWKRVRERKQ